MNNEKVENYAKSLVKHGLCSTIDEARAESIRWHKKQERGLEEPLQCPHHPDIETTVTHTKNGGMIVEYKLPKN
jgi:hypothetical protein